MNLFLFGFTKTVTGAKTAPRAPKLSYFDGRAPQLSARANLGTPAAGVIGHICLFSSYNKFKVQVLWLVFYDKFGLDILIWESPPYLLPDQHTTNFFFKTPTNIGKEVYIFWVLFIFYIVLDIKDVMDSLQVEKEKKGMLTIRNCEIAHVKYFVHI